MILNVSPVSSGLVCVYMLENLKGGISNDGARILIIVLWKLYNQICTSFPHAVWDWIIFT